MLPVSNDQTLGEGQDEFVAVADDKISVSRVFDFLDAELEEDIAVVADPGGFLAVNRFALTNKSLERTPPHGTLSSNR